MRINELQLDPNTINFLKSEGYTELYPPQKDAVKAGVLDGKSILVSVPTASGKTLIAMLAAISHLSKNKSKVIYLTPLRALAAEKFEEFKKLEKINGYYAIVIEKENYILAATDRVNTTPIFFSEFDDEFVLSDDFRSIFKIYPC